MFSRLIPPDTCSRRGRATPPPEQTSRAATGHERLGRKLPGVWTNFRSARQRFHCRTHIHQSWTWIGSIHGLDSNLVCINGPVSNSDVYIHTDWVSSGASRNFEKTGEEDYMYQPVVIYRKCTYWTIPVLYGKNDWLKKILRQIGAGRRPPPPSPVWMCHCEWVQFHNDDGDYILIHTAQLSYISYIHCVSKNVPLLYLFIIRHKTNRF